MAARTLAGFRIGVTADRRADEQIKLLAGRGASCLHGPVIKTHPVGLDDALRQATQAVIDDPPDKVVLTTGLGVRSWIEAAEALHLADQLHDLLAECQLLARGPKAKGALVTAGLEVDWNAPNSRYDDIIAHLADEVIVGHRVAVQLDGAGAAQLCADIAAMGADVVAIPVYRWSLPADTAPAERLIREVVDGSIDGITFTARPAVENMFEIASFIGLGSALATAFEHSVDAFCVGPVCATGLTDVGVSRFQVPPRHRLGSMVQQMSAHYGGKARVYELDGVALTVQGRTAVVGGHEVNLAAREQQLLSALLERPMATVSKADLLRRVWGEYESDQHLVEVTIARLRQRLGPAGSAIETVVRRGYRLRCVA